MSLLKTDKFRVGIIASKGFDDKDFLSDKFGLHLDKIVHLYTNGVNEMVTEFARTHGLSYTVFPPNFGNSILWSNNRIIENSDKVYILSNPNSKNSSLAKEECEKRNVKFELVERDSLLCWKEKVCKINEISEAVSENSLAENVELKSYISAIKAIL